MNRNYYLRRDGRKKENRIIDIMIGEISIIGIIYLVGYLIPILFK
jgi:hypothetical protein